MNPPPRQVLMTGYPTFAARHLLFEILAAEPDTRVWCVVRDEHIHAANALLPDEHAARVSIMPGNVRSLDLGLTGQQYLDLTQKVTDIYHLAGLWDISAPTERLHAANVRGTLNIIQCARDCQTLKLYNHFSTAFICGDRTGVIMEEEFDEGQSFLNAFEESCFKAEKEVRKHMDLLPTAIYRPSLIVGHSTTGHVDKLNGPYALMAPLIQLNVEVPLPLPGSGMAPLNMVPVDYVARAMHQISLHPGAVGRTFHIVDPNPLAARRALELVALAAGRPLPRSVLPASLTQLFSQVSIISRKIRPGVQAFQDLNRWLSFNAINSGELLNGQTRCPSFPSYTEALVKHLQERKTVMDPSFDGVVD